MSQKDSIALRLAQRKKRVAEKRFENRSVIHEFQRSLTAKKGASVLIPNDGLGFGFNSKKADSSNEGPEISVHLNNSTN